MDSYKDHPRARGVGRLSWPVWVAVAIALVTLYDMGFSSGKTAGLESARGLVERAAAAAPPPPPAGTVIGATRTVASASRTVVAAPRTAARAQPQRPVQQASPAAAAAAPPPGPPAPLPPTGVVRPVRAKAGKNVVVGMAKGIAPKPLAIFLRSLRKFSSCDVVLWVDQRSFADAKTRALLKEGEVETVVFDPESLTPAFMNIWHPSSYRWVFIYEFLKQQGPKRGYEGILFADVRDTAFQGDPFEILGAGKGFYASSEDLDSPKKDIAGCGWNSGWIKSCYGTSVLNKVGRNPIMCSGMSVSSFKEGLAYAKAMNDKLVSASGRSCERNGVDQGMHNVLVWTGAIDNLHVVTQESGPIANMQSKLVEVTPEKVVKNKKGQVMAVVHQYDRDMSVLRAFQTAYVDWKDDPQVACARYDLDDTGRDLFAGRCDMGLSGGATSASDCCRSCEAWKGCQAFAFSKADGKCYIKDCQGPRKGGRVTSLRGGGTTGWIKDSLMPGAGGVVAG